jgi:hypothetical protein
LLWCQLPLFSPQWGDWSSCSLMGLRNSTVVAVGSTGSLCSVVGRPLRVVDCHSVQELGFQVLGRRDVILLQGGAVWSTGFLCALGDRGSGAACRVAGCTFASLSGEPGILALWLGSEGSLAVRDSGEAGPPCSVGRKPPGAKNSKIWSLRFTSLGCVVAGSWHWVANWGFPWVSRAGGLELSGVHKAVEALESTCVGAWASRSHFGSCCRCRGSKSAGSERKPWGFLAGTGLPGAMATARGTEESSLWAAGVLGPAFQEGSAVVLQAWETKSLGSGSPGAWFPAWASGSTVQWFCCRLSSGLNI